MLVRETDSCAVGRIKIQVPLEDGKFGVGYIKLVKFFKVTEERLIKLI
jgi:hypothetical protein